MTVDEARVCLRQKLEDAYGVEVYPSPASA